MSADWMLLRIPEDAIGDQPVGGHFRVGDDGVPVEVSVVEPTGSETLLAVKAAGQELTCVFRERVLPKPGETIRIRPEVGFVHLFGRESGTRL
jgi:multiple sugar transport system ATP-binding protein